MSGMRYWTNLQLLLQPPCPVNCHRYHHNCNSLLRLRQLIFMPNFYPTANSVTASYQYITISTFKEVYTVTFTSTSNLCNMLYTMYMTTTIYTSKYVFCIYYQTVYIYRCRYISVCMLCNVAKCTASCNDYFY